MSATHRTKEQKAASTDFYATPKWAVEAIMSPAGLHGDYIFDPCAGNGAILEAFAENNAPDHALAGIELDEKLVDGFKVPHLAKNVTVRDALSPESWGVRQHVVMNPPFQLAEAFIRRALKEVAPQQNVVALLRLGFLEGLARMPLHLEYPSNIFILPRRPSFTGSGTDASAYAWFVWGNYVGGQWSILEVPERAARPVDWPSSFLRAGCAYGFQIDVPNHYPDGTPIGTLVEATDLASMACDTELRDRIQARRAAGVPLENLRRIFAPALEAKVIEMMRAGVRVTAPARKTRGTRTKPIVEAQPARTIEASLAPIGDVEISHVPAEPERETAPEPKASKPKRTRKPKPQRELGAPVPAGEPA